MECEGGPGENKEGPDQGRSSNNRRSEGMNVLRKRIHEIFGGRLENYIEVSQSNRPSVPPCADLFGWTFGPAVCAAQAKSATGERVRAAVIDVRLRLGCCPSRRAPDYPSDCSPVRNYRRGAKNIRRPCGAGGIEARASVEREAKNSRECGAIHRSSAPPHFTSPPPLLNSDAHARVVLSDSHMVTLTLSLIRFSVIIPFFALFSSPSAVRGRATLQGRR